MRESERIADQLERSQRGPAWHGPALGELLAGVDVALAQWRPLGGTHNIWEILLHITAWQSAALKAVNGGRMPELTGFEDWPGAGSTEPKWRQAVERVDRINRELVAAIEEFPDDRLGETVPGRDYSFYFLLHGIVQHNLYHAGQIALLRAAARNEIRTRAPLV
ncbi:MAG TPA: DinB family protein [Bryobacteraceae bacterium]|nr:DinB family protein [Bryobacteraceae bacterium]